MRKNQLNGMIKQQNKSTKSKLDRYCVPLKYTIYTDSSNALKFEMIIASKDAAAVFDYGYFCRLFVFPTC